MFPQTISTAIVSPNALDKARTVAAIIPGNDFLRMTFFAVCHFVAPMLKEGAAFVIMILTLMFKPSGLFGKGRL